MTAEGRIPFNGPLYGLSQLGLIVGTIPGLPKSFSIALLLPIFWISYHLITQTTSGDLPVDVALGPAILTQLMIGIDAMFLTNPDSLANLKELSMKGKKVTEQPLKERVRFAFNLYVNPRGIGWAHEHRHLPSRPPPSMSPSAFALKRMSIALACVECVAYSLNASNPGMTTPDLGLRHATIAWRALGVLSFATAGAARICALNCVLAALAVGLGFSTPNRWPWLFGNITEAWSIQRFWRRVWHQLLRKSLVSATRFLLAVFGLSPLSSQSSLFYKFLFLYTAFFIIGLIHIGGEYMLLGKWYWDGAFAFFQLQAVGITFEKLVCWLWTTCHGGGMPAMIKVRCDEQINEPPHAKRNGHQASAAPRRLKVGEYVELEGAPPLWIRCVGYLWVASWFVWSLAFMIDPMTSTNIFVDPRVDLRRIVAGRGKREVLRTKDGP